MTDPLKACPSTEQLKALVDGSLSDNEQLVLQQHVDGCTTCQQSLESMVAGSQSWDDAIRHVRSEPQPIPETVLSDAIKRMKADEHLDSPAERNFTFDPTQYLEPSDEPGSIGKLGAYQVIEVVGQGGMGVVLKAFDPALHRVLAIKVLAPYLAHNPQARKRFVREAQAIAAVSHDHVITIHGIDELADQPRIVMQYISGRSLQQKIDAEGSLELKEILRIGMQTASGLAAAHAQGLVHRDVKPSNILLENGIQRVKLTDFGLARAVDDASLTQSGAIAGTPQYMAPEQANGDAVDFRADLFSLGSVLYAMCVGHSPFRASTTMGVLKRVCHDPPRPIQEINPDIPDWLSAIVMKLLEKQPQDRYASAKSVAEILEKWLAHVQQPMVVPRPGTSPDASRERRREPLSAIASDAPSRAARDSASPQYVNGRTILFQTVSWRPVLFLILCGMAVIVLAGPGNGMSPFETLAVGLLWGLFTCFWGLLLLGLARFIWATIYGYLPNTTRNRFFGGSSEQRRSDPNDVDDSTQLSGWLPAESLAMLAAIIVGLCSANPLLAAIVAIIVWRVAKSRVAIGESPSTDFAKANRTDEDPKDPASPLTTQSRFQTMLDQTSGYRQKLAGFGRWLLDAFTVDRQILLIAIGWFAAGAIDLFSLIVISQMPILIAFLFMVMGLLSLAVSVSAYSRQNLGLIRGVCLIGLLPLGVGAFVRIPLSVLTLIWQRQTAIKASFLSTPWKESTLGRMVGVPLRLIGTFGWLGVWSALCFAFFLASFVFYLVPFAPTTYRVLDRSVVRLHENTNAQLQLISTGSGSSVGLSPSAEAFRRMEVRLDCVDKYCPPPLVVKLGVTPLNQSTERDLSVQDIQQYFQVLFGESYPEHASNLYQAIRRLNSTGGIGSTIPQSPPQESFLAHDLRLLGRYMNLGEIEVYNVPPGFVRLDEMLDPKLFPAAQRNVNSSFKCRLSSAFAPLYGLGLIFVWFAGVVILIRRRHFRKSGIPPLATAAAPA